MERGAVSQPSAVMLDGVLLASLLVAGVCLALCVPTSGRPSRGQGAGSDTIRGKVSGPDGQPVEVAVKLRTVALNVVDSTYSNSNGEFTFQGVADGVYHVSVESDLYQPVEVVTRVEWSTNPLANVDISLAARPSQTPKAQGGYRHGSHTISIQELRAKFPRKAIKEYEKGNEQMKRGEREAAIRSYRKATALAPALYPALNNLGNAYLEGKQMSEAEEVFRRALAVNPEGAEPYINLGHLYYESRRYDEAEKFLLRGLDRSSDSALGYFFLGSTHARLGHFREAEINLKKALSLDDPGVAVAHVELANLYLRTNRQRNALEELEAFLKKRPQDPQAEQIRRTLTRLKEQSEQPR